MKTLLMLAMLLTQGPITPQSSGVVVSVTVLVEGGEVTPPFTLEFSHRAGTLLIPVVMDTGFGNAFMVLSSSEADRTLNVQLPEGDCRVNWRGLPDNYSVQSIAAGPVDLRRSLLTVTRSATPRVVVTLKVEKLRGRAVRGNVDGLPPQVLAARPPVALNGEGWLISTRTRADGSFEFLDVPPGAYVARVARTLGVQPSPQKSVVVAGKDIGGLRIEMPPLKMVRGRAVVEGTGPLRQLSFQVSGGPLPRTVSGVVTLGPDGAFGILIPEGNTRIAINTAALPVGYTLRSLQYGSTDLQTAPSVRISSSDTAELRAVVAVTNVGATIRLADATEIVAIEGAPNAWVPVRGRVSGVLPGDSRLLLYLHSQQVRVIANGARGLTLTGMSASGVSARLNFDGTFEFPKVTQGRYILSAGMPGFAVYRSIEVTEKEINDIELVIPERKMVTGRIVVEGGGLLPRGYGFTLSSSAGDEVFLMVKPACNGSFSTRLPEGDYRVSTALPSGYIGTFAYGSANLLRDSLKVSPDDKAELRITFSATTTAGTGVIGGNFFGGTNFSGLDNGPPLPPPLLALTINPGASQVFPAPQPAVPASETLVNGCVFIAGGSTAETIDSQLRFTGKSSLNVPVMPDGSFRATVPKGEYRVTLSALPPGHVLRSIRLGSLDIRREAFTLDEPQAFILVVVDPR